jgi:methionine-rich copper-binding protein CopC
MHADRYGSWAALLLVGFAAGCAGNGAGLDQNGQPISSGGSSGGGSSGGGPVTADFQSIQANVFTPICSKCHIGASAPEGLQLDAAHSYNLLVGVPSAEEPNLLRVKTGDPDNSYMVRKIEGPSAGIIGGQMPLGEPPLPQATINAIRQWVTNGAPNAPAAAAAAAQIFAVQTTAPLDKASVKSAPARILVTFTQDVDASLVNNTTVTLERIDPAPAVAGGAGIMPATARLAPGNPAVLMITPNARLTAGVYRVTVRGTGGGALANMNAVALGTDTAFEFTVEPAQ